MTMSSSSSQNSDEDSQQEKLMMYASFVKKYSKYHRVPYHAAMGGAREAYMNYKNDFMRRAQENKVAQPIIPGKKKVVAKKVPPKPKAEETKDVEMVSEPIPPKKPISRKRKSKKQVEGEEEMEGEVGAAASGPDVVAPTPKKKRAL